MSRVQQFRTFLMAVFVTLASLAPIHHAHAGMIGTDAVLIGAEQAHERDALRSLLMRDDVAAQLEAHGVSAEQALARVERMTNLEVAQLHNRIGEIPAGADLGSAILIVFIVFVITDVIGATDIFPFIRPVTVD
ncbi:MAG: DUF6627 family protein [Pseudomonadota bacterium]